MFRWFIPQIPTTARSWVFYISDTWAIVWFLPGCNSRKLNQKWSYWGLNSTQLLNAIISRNNLNSCATTPIPGIIFLFLISKSSLHIIECGVWSCINMLYVFPQALSCHSLFSILLLMMILSWKRNVELCSWIMGIGSINILVRHW